MKMCAVQNAREFQSRGHNLLKQASHPLLLKSIDYTNTNRNKR